MSTLALAAATAPADSLPAPVAAALIIILWGAVAWRATSHWRNRD